MITTAAIMARGLGRRMRERDDAVGLDASQRAAADAGVKGMIPIRRPFVEYIVSALADAGITDVVLVVGPEHQAVRDHFTHDVHPTRVRIRFAVQAEASGTAHAVVAAADVIGDEPFLVLNADNYYPVEALRALAADDRAGTIAFDRTALSTLGNIDRERVRAFAVLDVSADGRLLSIIEKPGESLDLDGTAARWIGMNCWAVTPQIVNACRRVARSSRGEFELPEAVGLALGEGALVRAVCMSAPVLDLSRRSDVAAVAELLAHIEPRL